jgi:hypothetical protein
MRVRLAVSLACACAVAASLGAVACSSAPGDDDAVVGEAQALTECDLSGKWAMKIELPVTWPASFILRAGSGTIVNWALSSRVQSNGVDGGGPQIVDTARVCGVQIPDYQATSTFGNEKYGVRFADAVFDAPSMPTFSLTATLSSREVGATFSTRPVAAVVGAQLTNPVTDPWPAVASIVGVDADGDGKPGLSGDAAQGAGMSNPPVNPSRTVRANRVYTAFRQVLSAQGRVASCSRAEAKGIVATINNKPVIDSRVLGCRRVDGTECNASEFKLLDSAAPAYKPAGDVKITMVRVADDATCATVRALSFDPPAPPEPTNDQ